MENHIGHFKYATCRHALNKPCSPDPCFIWLIIFISSSIIINIIINSLINIMIITLSIIYIKLVNSEKLKVVYTDIAWWCSNTTIYMNRRQPHWKGIWISYFTDKINERDNSYVHNHCTLKMEGNLYMLGNLKRLAICIIWKKVFSTPLSNLVNIFQQMQTCRCILSIPQTAHTLL